MGAQREKSESGSIGAPPKLLTEEGGRKQCYCCYRYSNWERLFPLPGLWCERLNSFSRRLQEQGCHHPPPPGVARLWICRRYEPLEHPPSPTNRCQFANSPCRYHQLIMEHFVRFTIVAASTSTVRCSMGVSNRSNSHVGLAKRFWLWSALLGARDYFIYRSLRRYSP